MPEVKFLIVSAVCELSLPFLGSHPCKVYCACKLASAFHEVDEFVVLCTSRSTCLSSIEHLLVSLSIGAAAFSAVVAVVAFILELKL